MSERTELIYSGVVVLIFVLTLVVPPLILIHGHWSGIVWWFMYHFDAIVTTFYDYPNGTAEVLFFGGCSLMVLFMTLIGVAEQP